MKKLQALNNSTKSFNQTKRSSLNSFATWCPDCTRMDMFIPDILEAYAQNEWFEINKDDFPELAETYQVMGIPSLLIFKMAKNRSFTQCQR